MNAYRGNAIAVGVLFIACTATAILSAIPLGSTLDGPDYLSNLAASGNRVVLTALIEFAWVATGAGIAIGLYPILRQFNAALALGSVAARVAEGVFVLIGTLCLNERHINQTTSRPASLGQVKRAMRRWRARSIGTSLSR